MCNKPDWMFTYTVRPKMLDSIFVALRRRSLAF